MALITSAVACASANFLFGGEAGMKLLVAINAIAAVAASLALVAYVVRLPDRIRALRTRKSLVDKILVN